MLIKITDSLTYLQEPVNLYTACLQSNCLEYKYKLTEAVSYYSIQFSISSVSNWKSSWCKKPLR